MTGAIGNVPYYGLTSGNDLSSGSLPTWGPFIGSGSFVSSQNAAIDQACTALNGTWTAYLRLFTVSPNNQKYIAGTCTYTVPQGTTNPGGQFCFDNSGAAVLKQNALRSNCQNAGGSFSGVIQRYNDNGSENLANGYWHCTVNNYCALCNAFQGQNILAVAGAFCCASDVLKEPKNPPNGYCQVRSNINGFGYTEDELFLNQSTLCSSTPAGTGSNPLCAPASVEVCDNYAANPELYQSCRCNLPVGDPNRPSNCDDDGGGSSGSGSSSSGGGDSSSSGGGDSSSSVGGDSSSSFDSMCFSDVNEAMSAYNGLVSACQAAGGHDNYDTMHNPGGLICVVGSCDDRSSSSSAEGSSDSSSDSGGGSSDSGGGGSSSDSGGGSSGSSDICHYACVMNFHNFNPALIGMPYVFYQFLGQHYVEEYDELFNSYVYLFQRSGAGISECIEYNLPSFFPDDWVATSRALCLSAFSSLSSGSGGVSSSSSSVNEFCYSDIGSLIETVNNYCPSGCSLDWPDDPPYRKDGKWCTLIYGCDCSNSDFCINNPSSEFCVSSSSGGSSAGSNSSSSVSTGVFDWCKEHPNDSNCKTLSDYCREHPGSSGCEGFYPDGPGGGPYGGDGGGSSGSTGGGGSSGSTGGGGSSGSTGGGGSAGSSSPSGGSSAGSGANCTDEDDDCDYGGSDSTGTGEGCKNFSNCDWAKYNTQVKQFAVEKQMRDSLIEIAKLLRYGYNISNDQLRALQSMKDSLSIGLRGIGDAIDNLAKSMSARDSNSTGNFNSFLTGWGEMLDKHFGTGSGDGSGSSGSGSGSASSGSGWGEGDYGCEGDNCAPGGTGVGDLSGYGTKANSQIAGGGKGFTPYTDEQINKLMPTKMGSYGSQCPVIDKQLKFYGTSIPFHLDYNDLVPGSGFNLAKFIRSLLLIMVYFINAFSMIAIFRSGGRQ